MTGATTNWDEIPRQKLNKEKLTLSWIVCWNLSGLPSQLKHELREIVTEKAPRPQARPDAGKIMTRDEQIPLSTDKKMI